MADLIGICGNSGIGKTTSMRTLEPQKTLVISILGKSLPFAGWKKNYTKLTQEGGKWIGNFYSSNNIEKIINVFKLIHSTRPEIKNIVIDDANYLMSCEAMSRSDEKGYEKHTQMARHYYDMLMTAAGLRDDLKIFILSHSENAGDILNPFVKLKTLGKMLDTTVNIDGLFTYLLFAEMIEDDNGEMKRVFRTNTIKGEDTCKTPFGCFKDLYIPNDLKLVADTIDKYNEGELV